METIEYSVCEDCLMCIAHGISESAPDEHDNAFSVGVEIELGGKAGHFCAGIEPTDDDPEGTGYEEFSRHECEVCRTSLAGSRHGATLVITDEPIQED